MKYRSKFIINKDKENELALTRTITTKGIRKSRRNIQKVTICSAITICHSRTIKQVENLKPWSKGDVYKAGLKGAIFSKEESK